ncbi:hypothetical protein MK139_13635 [bacterium]|nr:hypothetical protein [bacterium]
MPIELPPGFNPETGMIAREVDGKQYHAPIPAVVLAYNLLESGTPEDLTQAERTLRAVISCQETRSGDPHLGNFLWEREDEAVEDLNAVQFILFNLIPLMIQWQDRLSGDLQEELRDAIRLGLEEIARIDVHVDYTNIVLKDITNTCLGGELLGDKKIAKRGYDKLVSWMRHTDRSGIPTEFNSPGYAGVAIRVLDRLIRLVEHQPTRHRAKVYQGRLGLSIALHISTTTGRWAGPYSRAYLDQVLGTQALQPSGQFAGTKDEHNLVRQWIGKGVLPSWLNTVLDIRPSHFRVNETANAKDKVAISSYHSPVFDFGIASQELTAQSNRFIALQSNVCIAHYTRPDDQPTGIFLTRYLTDDHWVGDYRQTPSRSASLLAEEGRFHGVQDGPRAIGLYAPRAPGSGDFGVDGWNRCSSAKAALIWDRADLIDEIWVDDTRVTSLPCDVSRDATIVIATGDVLFAVRPLTIQDLGVDAPIRLIKRHGNLLFEMHNYKGPTKTFWEQALPGSFFQGLPQCGFYLELADRSENADAAAFCQLVSQGELLDVSDPPFTYDEGKERIWRVTYRRDQLEVGIEVDLMKWKLKRRWTDRGKDTFPPLDSPFARGNRSGHVEIGPAELDCGKQAAWLFAARKKRYWVAGYHGTTPKPLTLTVPDGEVKLKGFAAGTIVWDNGEVSIEAATVKGKPQIDGGKLVSMITG